MLSNLSLTRSQAARVRAAALWMGLSSIAYAGLSASYFHADFFQFLGCHSDLAISSHGIGVHLNGAVWSNLSVFRIFGALLSVFMLMISAVGLWMKHPRARILALTTLWGVVLPQTFWYTEFLADWRQGQHILPTLAAGLAFAAIPTLLLFGQRLVRKFEGRDASVGWSTLFEGRARMVLAIVVLCWIGFAGANFIDHSYRLPSNIAYAGGLGAFFFSGLAVFGALRLRAWALWLGVIAALSLALIPVSSLWTPYIPNVGWHIDSMYTLFARCELQRALWALVPVAIVWKVSEPFLKGFLRKLRDEE